MDISKDEAKSSLGDIDRIMVHTKQKWGMGNADNIIIVWGVVLIVCYGLLYFYPANAGKIWIIGDAIGMLLTAYFIWSDHKKKDVLSDDDKRQAKVIGYLWANWALFSFLIFSVMSPSNGAIFGAMLIILMMFMYAIMGVVCEFKSIMVIGWFVGISSAVGFVMADQGWLGRGMNYALWLSFMCGGGLLAGGLYMKLRWKTNYA